MDRHEIRFLKEAFAMIFFNKPVKEVRLMTISLPHILSTRLRKVLVPVRPSVESVSLSAIKNC